MISNLYMINETTAIGNDTTVCQSCVETISKAKQISKTKAARSLYGRFTGQKMIHIGNIMICDKCLKKFYNDFFEKDNNTKGDAK